MNVMTRALLALAALIVFAAVGPKPASAQAIHPWCSVSGDAEGAMVCVFFTFEQCRQFARGDGHCQRNPRFDWPYFRRGEVPPQDVDPYSRPLRRYRR